MKHRLVFNVLQGKYPPILSLDASDGMGVLKIKDSDPLDYVYSTHEAAKKLSACAVKAEYTDVFQGLGRLKDSYSIEIDESVRPVVHAPRRVPVPVRENVHKKVDELVCAGVLTPVAETTDWVSSMVIVQKPSGQIRICLNPKDLNTVIRREYYIEEASTRLTNERLFTVLDAKNELWQIQKYVDVFQHAIWSVSILAGAFWD